LLELHDRRCEGNGLKQLARVRRWLAGKREGLPAGVDRPELEQFWLRLAIAAAVMFYLFWYSYSDGQVDPSELATLWVSVGFFLFAIVMIAIILIVRGVSPLRRYLAIVVDNVVTTFCLSQMGEGGAVVIGAYLFIAFGNGFRYGRRYLHVCQALSIAGFTYVLWTSEFWSQHVAIGVGFLIGLVVLPIYVSVLSERIKAARRRADEASRAKGRFVANVSHEMRTPLNGVIAMADILRETDLTEAQREIVETMTTSAQLLLAQIEDVLDMAKIEAGRVHVESRPFDLPSILSSTVKVIVPQARYKGIEVLTEVPASASRWFSGDSHHLRQVLLNLLSNAVKFTETGRIVIRVSAKGTAQPAVARLRFEVEDTGIGIAPDKQAKIFEPFTQADDSTTRVYGGTGLGTTIAKHLVQLMGGTIGVVSTLGRGSVFWFEIELTEAETQGVDLTAELAATRAPAVTKFASTGEGSNVHKLRGARVLVAEDNATNQRVAQLILESGGHVVTTVGNGEGALDALERSAFDIALFDLSMPVVSGLEALKLYRFSNPKPIPVLILSANVTTETIAECLRAGAAEFIPKPLRASFLLDAIERHLSAQPGDAVRRTPAVADERSQLSLVSVPALDEQVLEDLARLSPDPTFMDRLMKGFHADTTRLVCELSDALAQRKYMEAKDVAHALKGGAASVGASQLVHVATRIEKCAPEALRMRSVPLTEELVQASNRALAAVEQLLEDREYRRHTPGSR
jgi:two-component system sensor histidine kinase RpfC